MIVFASSASRRLLVSIETALLLNVTRVLMRFQTLHFSSYVPTILTVEETLHTSVALPYPPL